MDQIIHINYTDLIKGDSDHLQMIIKSAFGSDGLGLLIVDDVPGLVEKRNKCLRIIKKFADLPDNIKQQMEHTESLYSFGWSYGKEKMKKDTPDFLKGSYYFNPESDLPYDSVELQQQYPSFCCPNIWPNEQLPEFKTHIMDLSKLILDVSRFVLLGCDQVIKSHYSQQSSFSDININSKVHKGRMLHYFPISSFEKTSSPQELWCGWHNDHGCLTALVAPLYLNQNDQEVACPDPNCGLYIKSRNGTNVKVSLPPNCLAFQIGEAACIHSGGLFQATPHMVVAPNNAESIGISRETMAIFMNPRWDHVLNPPLEVNTDQMFLSNRFLPEGVPLLSNRWSPGITYGDYAERTYKSYY